MTPLDKSLKRTLTINGRDYVVALTPDALKITQKGHRLGMELKWADLVSGQSALAVALNASVGNFEGDVRALPRKSKDFAPQAIAKSTRRIPGKRSPPKRSR
jgi:hypothetical protein